ncbi:dUTP diphosphatase [Pseudomonadales bacterium]|nr:dUTP diphosphatase [Pseudomonadales bacterium]
MQNTKGQVLQKVETMLAMQDSMNTKVHTDWITQNFAWYRAAWVECGELMDHFGYKWWKKQTPDIEQVRLEVIDIWHFGMSALFTQGVSQADLAAQITDAIVAHQPLGHEVLPATEALAQNCIATKSFSVAIFWHLLDAVDLDIDSLFKSYVGKNVLNFFRQDNGYKDGSYRKEWQGREDNEHLSDILAGLDSDKDGFRNAVYNELAKRYAATVSEA